MLDWGLPVGRAPQTFSRFLFSHCLTRLGHKSVKPPWRQPANSRSSKRWWASDMLVINQICLSSQSTDLSDSFKEWPFANITTKQIYECILISPVLQSTSVSRWDSFEIDIPGKPGGAGQHVQGDHDDQQGHHGATGAFGDEYDPKFWLCRFCRFKGIFHLTNSDWYWPQGSHSI